MERIVCVAIAVMLFFSSAAVKAEDIDIAALNSAEKSLNSIEQNLNSIESTKEIRKSNNAVEAQLDNYLKQMQLANQKRLEKASEKAKGGGEKEAGDDIDVWESTLAKHKARIDRVANRISTVATDINEGKITVSREVIEEFSDEELEGFKQSVKEDILRNKYSDVVFRKDSFKWVSELISPSEANAAMAVGCVWVCKNIPNSCIPCIGTAIGTATSLYQNLQAGIIYCNNIRWSWLRTPCKVALIAAYIGIIA